jgi:hypothetical protein
MPNNVFRGARPNNVFRVLRVTGLRGTTTAIAIVTS